VLTVLFQVLIIQFGGLAFRTVPLNGTDWFVTVLIGFGSLPLGLILRVIPVPVLDAWGFGEIEQKLRSESKLARMRERHLASKMKNSRGFDKLEGEA